MRQKLRNAFPNQNLEDASTLGMAALQRAERDREYFQVISVVAQEIYARGKGAG